ncbi:MAG: D-alanyl-D-alanine carboxypeptidase/D-alanyl-D-alanine-endopeptidase [bacterium]|nr:D-alanyl-D-alanine carboxypeptidase/D-alanyl-D-alanine-endopeptidase [bacterium]
MRKPRLRHSWIRLWNHAWIALGISISLLAGEAQAEKFEEKALESFVNDPAIRGANLSVVLEELATGERLLEHSADHARVPASNQKLMIATAAFAHWGPTYRFETPIYADGSLRDGVLDGTLWVVGKGDPTLVSESLWKLAEELRLLGIREIKRGIGIDQSYFDGVTIHPDWQPASARAYNARVAAFAANYSSFRIEVRPGPAIGKPAQVDVAPMVSYFRTRSDALTVKGKSRLDLSIVRLADGIGEQVRIRGSVPIKAEPRAYWRAVSQPGPYASAILRRQLEAQGIRVTGSTRFGSLPESARELMRFKGAPLGENVKKLNKWSNNFIAEQLTKALGAEIYGAPGSWEKGTRAIGDHLRSIGLDAGHEVIADGSGLSPRNRISAAILTALIRDAVARFDYGPEFLASLPLGGLDGTLRDRMNGSAIPVRGKTGHLRRVSSLSGVLPAASGRRRVFSILVNGAKGGALEVDRAIDALVAGMAGRVSEEAPAAASD